MTEVKAILCFLAGTMSVSLIGALAERFPALALLATVVLGLVTGAGVILAGLGLAKLINGGDPLNPGAINLIGLGAVVLLAVAIGTGVVSYALR